jgi:hypothetical protein
MFPFLPELLKLIDVCPRVDCSRCAGQIIEEWELRRPERTIPTTDIEQATVNCADLIESLMAAQKHIAEALGGVIPVLRTLDRAHLDTLLSDHFCFAGMCRLSNDADEFSWLNIAPDALKSRSRVSHFRYTHEDFL